MTKIVLSDLLKKRLKLAGYLLVFGLVTYVSKTYLETNEGLSIIFGGLANFVVWEIGQELNKEGVSTIIRTAVKK